MAMQQVKGAPARLESLITSLSCRKCDPSTCPSRCVSLQRTPKSLTELILSIDCAKTKKGSFGCKLTQAALSLLLTSREFCEIRRVAYSKCEIKRTHTSEERIPATR